jgi:hypothetical protein
MQFQLTRRLNYRFAAMMLCGSLLLLALSEPASAQDGHPYLEIFGGASYLPADGQDFPRKNSFGFQTSIAANLNSWFGILGDFGGQYRHVSDLGPNFPGVTADTSVYEYLVGPRFTKRSERVNLFVHALVGGASGRTNLRGFADSLFTLAGGGGFDINVSRRIAIRPVQLDFIGSFVDMLEDNIRFGAGIVIRIGDN